MLDVYEARDPEVSRAKAKAFIEKYFDNPSETLLQLLRSAKILDDEEHASMTTSRRNSTAA